MARHGPDSGSVLSFLVVDCVIAFAVLTVVSSYKRLTRETIPTLSVDLSEGDHKLLIAAQPAQASQALNDAALLQRKLRTSSVQANLYLAKMCPPKIRFPAMTQAICSFLGTCQLWAPPRQASALMQLSLWCDVFALTYIHLHRVLQVKQMIEDAQVAAQVVKILLTYAISARPMRLRQSRLCMFGSLKLNF